MSEVCFGNPSPFFCLFISLVIPLDIGSAIYLNIPSARKWDFFFGSLIKIYSAFSSLIFERRASKKIKTHKKEKKYKNRISNVSSFFSNSVVNICGNFFVNFLRNAFYKIFGNFFAIPFVIAMLFIIFTKTTSAISRETCLEISSKSFFMNKAIILIKCNSFNNFLYKFPLYHILEQHSLIPLIFFS